MVENIIRQTSKKTWYRLSVYINLILFFIVALGITLMYSDFITKTGDEQWISVTRDIAVIAVALALIFYQFFRNLYIIMKRSL
ncbi:MAG: hypothetical protein DRQ06_04040 [Candidatus Hydrothermota bacterium]|nr:MAG: hypothetical protein DRQ06_04040 [Candidatus Hydrothermae bacterium]